MIEIVDPGLLTTVQDLGRPGYGAIGVPPSGAVDRAALIAANRMVGNDAGAAGLETTLVGAGFRVASTALVAVTGAPATVTVDGEEAGFATALEVPAGATLRVGPAEAGVRSYIAIAGGVDAEPVLGSRSTDLLTGLGPKPLDATVIVPLGTRDGGSQPIGVEVEGPPVPADCVVRVVPGPRPERLAPGALEMFEASEWKASPRSNRIGVRLEGQPLEQAVGAARTRSEGLVTGAIQLPPSGLPTVMLADHPTTGGYPVLAVVVEEDIRLVGQIRPGQTVAFRIS